jgi:hypothetical protein
MRQSGHWQGSQLLSYETLLSLLNERFAAVDYRGIKEDVIPFLHTTNSLELWDEAFFTSITREFLRIA